MLGETAAAVWIGIGTVIGTFIGLAIKDAAGELGKRLVQRVTPGFSKADAKAKKIGELDAIQERLQELVEQTRLITSIQNQIQAEINGDLWLRQMHLTQKRDLYVSIFKIIANMRVLIGRLEIEVDPYGKEQTAEAAQLLDKYMEFETDLEATMGLARCFLSAQAISSLEIEQHTWVLGPPTTPQDRRYALGKLEFALVASARDELGTVDLIVKKEPNPALINQ
jgi:hypothetical protein